MRHGTTLARPVRSARLRMANFLVFAKELRTRTCIFIRTRRLFERRLIDRQGRTRDWARGLAEDKTSNQASGLVFEPRRDHETVDRTGRKKGAHAVRTAFQATSRASLGLRPWNYPRGRDPRDRDPRVRRNARSPWNSATLTGARSAPEASQPQICRKQQGIFDGHRQAGFRYQPAVRLGVRPFS